MDDFGELALREREARRIVRQQWFWLHFAVYGGFQIFLALIWVLGDRSYPWFIFPLFGWGIIIAAHAVYAFVVRDAEEVMVERAMRRGEDQA